MKISLQTKLLLNSLLTIALILVLTLSAVYISQVQFKSFVGNNTSWIAQRMLESMDHEVTHLIEEIKAYTDREFVQRFLFASNREFEKIADIQEYINQREEQWHTQSISGGTSFEHELLRNALSKELNQRLITSPGEGTRDDFDFVEVFVTNKHGAVISLTRKTSDYRQDDEEWWQVARAQGHHVSNIEYDESAGVYGISLSVSIRDEQNVFLGVIKAVLPIDHLIKHTQTFIASPATTITQLFTKDGRLLYSTEPFTFLEDFSESVFFVRMTGEDNHFIVNYKGKNRLFSYAHSKGFGFFEGLPLILVICYDAAEIFSPIALLRKSMLIVACTLTVLAFILSAALSRSITSPLLRLKKGAQQIGSGNLNYQIKIENKDEIGDVSKEFNRMVQSLRQVTASRDELNRQITERQQIETRLKKQIEFIDIVLESFSNPFYVIDARTHKVIMANNAARKSAAIEEEETCYALTHARDTPCDGLEHTCPLKEIRKTKKPAVVEHVHFDKHGNIRYVEVHGYPIFNEQGEVVQMIEYAIDITKRRQVEDTLRQSEEKAHAAREELVQGQAAILNILEDLQDAKEILETSKENFLSIVENSADGIVIVDEQGTIHFGNKSAAVLFGLSQGELVNKTFDFPFTKDEMYEATITSHDNESRFVEILATDTQWESQRMRLVFLHDVTERREAEETVRNAAQEWRSTFDAIADGVALLGREGKILRCNRALQEFIGKAFDEIIGSDCHMVTHGDEHQHERCPIHEAIELRKRATKTIQRGDRWFNIFVDPLVDENSEILGAVHIMSDITQEKRTEDKIREYTVFIENIVENAQAIIAVLDRQKNIISINRYTETITEYTKDDIVGRPWFTFLPQSFHDEAAKMIDRCLGGETINEFECPITTKKGDEKVISWYGSHLRDAQNNIVGVIAMGYDITQRRDMEKVQRLAQLGTLVSHMAHEVNNPLMVISGRAQLSLMEEIRNEEVTKNLKIVMNECQRAKDIIQRLLRFSRPSKGELKKIDINKSLEEVVSILEHQFKLINIRFEKEYAPSLPAVYVDEKQIHEVFMNLMTNARDAMGEKGIIKIRTYLDGDFVRIDFTDTGGGMPQAVIDKIFDPFFTTKTKGTGLGLSICYGIMKAHQGDLRFESTEGKGTTASMFIPYGKEENNA